MSHPLERTIHPHAGMLDGSDKFSPRPVDACRAGPYLFASVHCIGPVLAVVTRPVVEEEIGRLPNRANQPGNPRVNLGYGDRRSEPFYSHGASCAAIAAEVSAAGQWHRCRLISVQQHPLVDLHSNRPERPDKRKSCGCHVVRSSLGAGAQGHCVVPLRAFVLRSVVDEEIRGIRDRRDQAEPSWRALAHDQRYSKLLIVHRPPYASFMAKARARWNSGRAA